MSYDAAAFDHSFSDARFMGAHRINLVGALPLFRAALWRVFDYEDPEFQVKEEIAGRKRLARGRTWRIFRAVL